MIDVEWKVGMQVTIRGGFSHKDILGISTIESMTPKRGDIKVKNYKGLFDKVWELKRVEIGFITIPFILPSLKTLKR